MMSPNVLHHVASQHRAMDAKHPSSIAACGSKTCVAAKPHGDIGDLPHLGTNFWAACKVNPTKARASCFSEYLVDSALAKAH